MVGVRASVFIVRTHAAIVEKAVDTIPYKLKAAKSMTGRQTQSYCVQYAIVYHFRYQNDFAYKLWVGYIPIREWWKWT